MRQGDTDKAEECFKKCLEMDPEDGLGHTRYGSFLAGVRNDTNGAKEHYEEALRLDPKSADTHSEYAKFLELEGNFDEAEAHYTDAVRLSKDLSDKDSSYAIQLCTSARILLNVGQLEKAGEQVEEAEALFRKALAARRHMRRGQIRT